MLDCSRYARTNDDEQEEKFPTETRDRQERSSAPEGRSSASWNAWSTRGPPVCAIQCEIRERSNPLSCKKASTLPGRCSRTRLGTFADSTTLKPPSTRSQPITRSVFG